MLVACKPTPSPTTIVYTVTLDDQIHLVLDGQRVPFHEPEEREDEWFVGWFLNDELYDFNQPVTSNLTLTSKWSGEVTHPVTHTVLFDTHQVAVLQGRKVQYYQPDDREDYIFLGWYLDDALYDFNTVVIGNITLVSKWIAQGEAQTHTVSFDTHQVTVLEGKKVQYYQPQSRPGYVFSGWYLDDYPYDFNQPVVSDLILTSKWQIKDQTLDTEYFDLILDVATSNGLTAQSFWTGRYEFDRVVIEVEVKDEQVVNTGSAGGSDNIEFIIQSKFTDGWNKNYTLNFLATPSGEYWIRRATGFSAWGANLASSSYAHKGHNFDFEVELTDTGYRVEVYFTYELLNTTYEEAVDQVLLMPSLRNTNTGSGQTFWNYYRNQSSIYGVPYTYLTLAQNGQFFQRKYEAPSLQQAFDESGIWSDQTDLLGNLALVFPTGTTGIQKLDYGADLFTDRFFRVNYEMIPKEIQNLSYLYGSIDGVTGVVEQAGYLIMAAPTQDYPGIIYQLEANGYTKLIHAAYNFGATAPGYSGFAELTDYYVKWVEAGEIIDFGKWVMPLFRPLEDEENYTHQSWLTYEAEVIFDFTGYEEHTRLWQGVPSLEKTTGGRIYVGWVSGGTGEPRPENYNIVMYSDDDGTTWHDLFIIRSTDSNANINDVHFWQAPNGDLWVFYVQSKNGNSFDGKSGVWAFIIDNPDAPINQLNLSQPKRLFDGLLRSNPEVLPDGTWLAAPNNFADDNYAIIYQSTDEGQTWTERSRAYIPDARSFDEVIIVQKEDGSIWLTFRATVGQIVQTFSYDGGYTWEPSSYSGINNPSTRFQIIRLSSGNLLMINNDSPSSRINMTAFLSTDDGATWPYRLLLDTRSTTYPDVRQSADGNIHLTYDVNRISSISTVIYMKITEQEIIQGGTLPANRRIVISTIEQTADVTEGETLGSSPTLQATGGFDATNDTGENGAYVEQKSSGDQYIYFKDFNGVDFYAETEVTALSVLNNDAYPKFGIVLRNQNTTLFYYVDSSNHGNSGIFTVKRVGYVLGSGSGNWQWGNSVEIPVSIQYRNGETVHLAIARTGNQIAFFVNGYKVMEVSDIAGFDNTQASSVGLLTFNTRARFYDSQISTEATVIQNHLNADKQSQILFIGDSFVDTYRWTTFYNQMHADELVNIGVGGTKIEYWQANIQKLLMSYNPEHIVMHIGINDINSGTTGNNTYAQLVTLFNDIHAALPNTKIHFILISPSINNWGRWDQTVIANQQIKVLADGLDYLNYIDLTSDLLGENNQPIAALYSDGLHLSAEGYVIWEARIKEKFPEIFNSQ